MDNNRYTRAIVHLDVNAQIRVTKLRVRDIYEEINKENISKIPKYSEFRKRKQYKPDKPMETVADGTVCQKLQEY